MTSTILVVEDEETLREFVSDVLRMSGYVVVEADSAASALAIWNKQKTLIDLLLTDYDLRGEMNGIELARKLRREEPALEVIFVTGHDAQGLREEFNLDRSAVILEKPFRIEEMIAVVRDRLENAEREAASFSFLSQGSHNYLKPALA